MLIRVPSAPEGRKEGRWLFGLRGQLIPRFVCVRSAVSIGTGVLKRGESAFGPAALTGSSDASVMSLAQRYGFA